MILIVYISCSGTSSRLWVDIFDSNQQEKRWNRASLRLARAIFVSCKTFIERSVILSSGDCFDIESCGSSRIASSWLLWCTDGGGGQAAPRGEREMIECGAR